VLTRADRTAAFGNPHVPFAASVMIETTSNTADPGISDDGRVLLFTSNQVHPEPGNAAATDTEVWYALRTNVADLFGEPQRLMIGTEDSDGDPALSKDGCRVYWSSSRTAPMGDFHRDLFVAVMP
jgi:hypothetical protein